MDIRRFNSCVDGYTLRREVQINDDLHNGHIIAGKIAEAVWGSRDFRRPIKDVKLYVDEETVESRNSKVLQTLIAKGVV